MELTDSPSVLKYVSGNPEWGFEFLQMPEHQEWFKLQLDPQQDRKQRGVAAASFDPSATAFAKYVSIQQKITDILTGLREHAELVL